MAAIEDRWQRKDKTRTDRYGQGLRWRVNWIEPDGRRRSASFAVKAAAQAKLDEVRGDLHKGVYRPVDARRTLFEDYAASWQEQQIHQRDSSRVNIDRRMRNDVLPSFTGRALEDITRQEVQAAVLTWSRTLAPATVKVSYGYLASMMKAAVLDGHLDASPCVGIRMPKIEHVPIVPLPTEQVQRIANTMQAHYRPMVAFCAATGMRSSEMRGLTWDRVNLRTGTVRVDRQFIGTNSRTPVWGPPKTRSSIRSIAIGPATVELLKTLKEGPANAGGLVFGNTFRGAILRNTASDIWREVRETIREAKHGDIGDGWHQLRHYHASILIQGGMSPVAVAHRLGHKDAHETLNTYAHMFPDDDTRASALSDGLILPTPQ
ncbi:site-specific integrase [Arthrobacter sp. efr-133-TYG-118]|uniref:tyrosine-type recombinase/integrase n=1 Tax=Arthrobacter sp. efr-133-TYG-118 TaxID=3040279 RepID=UPI00254F61F6|nr:site-specific integrase [Arthrobacter sp. efr-133-TYG-118]